MPCAKNSIRMSDGRKGNSNMRNKREKFVELAEARVNKALKDLQLIGNLSNSSAYEFTETDIKKIFTSLQRGLDSAKSKFLKTSDNGGGEFKL